MKRKHFLTFRSFIMKLSQRIRLCSNDGSVGASSPQEDTEFFHKTFPFFVWLLRDVTQSIPTDCRDIKEYFLTRVRRLILKRWTEMTKELIKRFPEKNSLSQPQKYWLYHCFLGIDSYSLLYEQNNRVFENMVLFLGCKVYCLTFWRCTGFENGRNLVFFLFFFL